MWLADVPELAAHPAVIVSRSDENARRRKVIVAIVTGHYPPRRTSEIGLDESNGLQKPSVVQANELATIGLARLIEHQGTLDIEQLEALGIALRHSLDLNLS